MIYAVNKRTKEHRVLPLMHIDGIGYYAGECPDDYIVKADADGWIEWLGGECPLPDNHPYEAKCKTGRAVEDGRFKDPQA